MYFHHPRPRKSTIIVILPLAALIAATAGCVPQDRYDQLLTAHRSVEEQLTKTEAERDAERANIETLRNQLSRATANLNDLRAQNEALKGDLGGMAGQYDTLLRRVSELEIGPLPADMEIAIAELAARYPNVLSFDARRGLLRFASDFTFGLGSVALTGDAQQTLAELARILNTSEARSFEARVVGHTDDVPIAQEHTRRNHPTNMHLSVHRAIAVRDALRSAGVAPERMQVAGYGPYRPAVPHRAGGTAQNRRVEIFLVPMPDGIHPTSHQATSPTPPETTRTHVPDEPVK